jgi:hypothetical protein
MLGDAGGFPQPDIRKLSVPFYVQTRAATSHLEGAAGDLDFRLQLALWQIPKALEACASSLKVAGLVIQESKADIAWVFDVPLESVMSRLDAKQGGIG